MLLQAPEDCKYKRAWHFWKVFPRAELEYCTNKQLSDKYGEGGFTKFNALDFFAAWFSARRLNLNSKLGYRKDLPWANHTRPGHSFGNLPQDLYEIWKTNLRGYLPMERDYFLGSLIGARDREFAVCRLKPKLLKNLREAREPPLYFVCDEQIAPSTSKMSGLKKRLPKKKSEGIEYFSIATANKGYEG